MVDFIDEVNEELRRERLTLLWQKTGRYVITLSVLIVAATVSSVLWQNHKQNRQESAATAYLAAEKQRASKADMQAAEKNFTEIAQGSAGGFPALAQLKLAAIQRDAGKKAEAQAAYLALAEDKSAEAGLRNFARIYAAQLMSEAKTPYAEIETVLKPLAEAKNSPFAPLAKEQLVYAALSSGEKTKAIALLKEISADTEASPSLKQRVTVLESALDGSGS